MFHVICFHYINFKFARQNFICINYIAGTMQYAHKYAKDYSDTAKKALQNQHQQWDKRSQYHSVIKGSLGNRMPFYVKFPRISDAFEKLDKEHPWAKNRLGKYNGLYYVPNNPDQSGFEVDSVKFGDKDIRQEFFASPVYKLLQDSMQKCYNKLFVQNARTVLLTNQEYCFREDAELIALGKFKHQLCKPN